MTRGVHPVWEEAYPQGLAWDFTVPDKPLTSLLREAAKRHPARIAIDFLGARMTYRQLADDVSKLAAGLQGMGVKKGDRVALCLPNCPAYVMGYYAILTLGAVVVNCNPLMTRDELESQVLDSGAAVMLSVNLAKIFPKVAPLAQPGGPLRALVVADFAAMLPPMARWGMRLLKRRDLAPVTYGGGVMGLKPLVTHRRHLRLTTVSPGDLALLQYTGGTTGVPKAACLTHRNLLANTLQIKAWLGRVHGDCAVLGVLPLFHVFAMTTCMNLPLAIGGTMVLLPLFNMKMFRKTLRRTHPYIVPGVPSLFGAMVNTALLKPRDVAGIKWCISGGAPLPAEIRARFMAMTGCVLMEGYGLTEASPVVACNSRDGNVDGSVGLPLPGTEVEIRHIHNHGKVMKPGARGEVWVRGPQVMRGYWNRAAETAQVLKNGWLRTGDVGTMDKRGYVFLTDRIKDIIISHGYNVYPRVIEEAMHRHEAVAEVTAIAIPHPHKGQVAKIFVALKHGYHTTAGELMAFAHEHLNAIECPAEVEIRASLPKTLTGKLSKKELVAEEQLKREKML